MITSADINKVIRRELSPVLKQHGFSKMQTRHNWGWHGQCTWVLDIRAVGSHFRDVTGWPSMSVCVSLGVYYSFIPLNIPHNRDPEMPMTSDGNPLPKEWDAQMRSHLNCSLEQLEYKSYLENPEGAFIGYMDWLPPLP